MRPFPALVLGASAGILGGCGGDVRAGPGAWTSLARGFTPSATSIASDGGAGPTDSSLRMTGAEGGEGLWIETTLSPTAWELSERGDEWRTPNPLAHSSGDDGATDFRLRGPGGEWTLVHHRLGRLRPGEFFAARGRIALGVSSAAEVPGPLVLGFPFDAGTAEDGVWRTTSGGTKADAITVWAGQREEVPLASSVGSVLRFGTAFRVLPPGEGEEAAVVRFRVALDGAEFFDFRLEIEPTSTTQWHEVVLPGSDRADHRLAFSVDGPPGLGLFVTPVLGPANVGHYDERPWKDARPNLILFLPDTFRADNLAAYGGEDGMTPRLDELVERSLLLSQSWSTSTWTLPSQASALAGLYPPQHGADAHERAMPPDLTTIAELLAENGYRTGAVTDSGFISRVYGFDQGFEWFHERRDWDLRETFAQSLAFLERDDGRPVFLFVHTFRTHVPYRLGIDEDLAPWEGLLDEAMKWCAAHVGADQRPVDHFEVLLGEYGDEVRALYNGGVRALDEQAGEWFAEVERSGLLERGYFLFTSDHGEAFGEHGEVCHGGQPWQERVAVPMFLIGPDILPGKVSHPVSLLDVAPTLADLAGLRPAPPWEGRSLRRATGDRPLFSFTRKETRTFVGVLEGGRKSMVLADVGDLQDVEYQGLYDIENDPRELEDLSGEGQRAAALRWHRLTPEVLPLLQPRTDVIDIELDSETRRHLERIGYAGD